MQCEFVLHEHQPLCGPARPLLWQTGSSIPVLQPVPVQVARRLWEACHYTVMRRRCQAAGLQQMAAKQATSLLRYIGDIPADKAFYEAGGVPTVSDYWEG